MTRPTNFHDFIGQKRVVDQIRLAVSSAKARSSFVDHILLSGPPGLGKTTIANIIASDLGGKCVESVANIFKTNLDVATTLVNLKDNDVLFIDEIHALRIDIQEFLYTAMEDYKMVTMVGASTRKPVTITLKKFVLIGATTVEGLLSTPFLNRFGVICKLEPYTDDDLVQIVRNAAIKESIPIDEPALALIANCSRSTPRIALRLLRRSRDVAVVQSESSDITEPVVAKTFQMLGISKFGITDQDKLVLKVLASAGTTVGLSTISSSTNIADLTIMNVVEPHLLRIGAITKHPRGRMITDFGMRLLSM